MSRVESYFQSLQIFISQLSILIQRSTVLARKQKQKKTKKRGVRMLILGSPHVHTCPHIHTQTRIVGTQLSHPAQPSWPPEKVWLWDWWSSWPGSCCTLWSPPAATPWSQTPAPCCWTRARRWWGSSSSLRTAPSGWGSAGGWGWPGSCSSSSADTAWSVGWNERGSCTRCSWGRRGSTTGSRKPRSGTTHRRAEWWSHLCGMASAVDLENTGGQSSATWPDSFSFQLHGWANFNNLIWLPFLSITWVGKFQRCDLTSFPFNYTGGKISSIWLPFPLNFLFPTIYIKLFPCQSIFNIAATPFL